MDRIDRRILAILQADGRISNATLSERVALSPSACLARVRRMEKDGVIESYGARVAVEKLRPTLIIHGEVTLRRHLPDDFRAVEKLFRADPRVLEAWEISGKSDYLVRVLVNDMQEWRDLTAEWTGGDWQIERISSAVAMHRTKAFAGFPLDTA